MDLAAERHRIRELLQRGEVAMLVTFDGGEAHSGRPMLPLWLQKDPHIYFLTHRDSRKVAQIGERPQVDSRWSAGAAISLCSAWPMRLEISP
jgi:general stress protein 26